MALETDIPLGIVGEHLVIGLDAGYEGLGVEDCGDQLLEDLLGHSVDPLVLKDQLANEGAGTFRLHAIPVLARGEARGRSTVAESAVKVSRQSLPLA